MGWKEHSLSFRVRALPNDTEVKAKRIDFLGWGENQLLESTVSISFDLSSNNMQSTLGALRIVEGRIDELTKRNM